MSKRLAVILLWAGIAALIGVLIWAISTGGGFLFSWNFGGFGSGAMRANMVTGSELEVPTEEIDSVELVFASEDIEISRGESGADCVIIRQIAEEGLPEEYVMRTAHENGRLFARSGSYVDQMGVQFGMNRIPYMRIELVIPDKLAGSITAGTVSGDISVTDVGASKMDLESTSGNVNAERIETDSMSMESTSGNLSAARSDLGTLEMSSTSGEILADEYTAASADLQSTSGGIRSSGTVEEELLCDTTSGEIVVAGTAGQAHLSSISGGIQSDFGTLLEYTASTTSGDVRFAASDVKKLSKIDCDTLSGNVRIEIPSGTAISTDFDSVSGSMHNEGEGSLSIGGAGINLIVSTTSGDLTLVAA